MEFENQRTVANCTGAEPPRQEARGSESLSSAESVTSASIVPVILSGGGGTRLWPISTDETPKQFLPLIGVRSLFQEALERVSDRMRFSAPIVVGSVDHADLCERELKSEGESTRLVLEPCARNTAAAIVMAAAVAREMNGEDSLILVMPSDHVIEDVAAFHDAINVGETAAREGRLVTFGVRPTGPDTGYGYLQTGGELTEAPGVKEVSRFIEKPQLDAAERMFQEGGCLWNAGIFLFRAATLIDEIMRHAPDIGLAALRAIEAAERQGIRLTADEGALTGCRSESIDYALMERSSRVAVVPMSPGWSDLGSWDALVTVLGMDASSGPITALDCNTCFIRSDGVQIAALGLRDLIIVASGQRLLILPRGRSEEVKKLISAMNPTTA